MKSPLIIVYIFNAATAMSQDSLSVKSIDDQVRKNYDRIDHTDWYLTHDVVVNESGPAGTQLSYHYAGDLLIRIVCSGYNKLGPWGKEYYPVDGELAFIYMTQEYFPDQVPPNTPLSWKKLPAHEYRVYLHKGKPVKVNPATWSGMPDILLKEFDALRKWKKK